ncbi:MAG TPA: hypothetical protein VF064_08475, partial [Pyrinomonadaceae bacterium]
GAKTLSRSSRRSLPVGGIRRGCRGGSWSRHTCPTATSSSAARHAPPRAGARSSKRRGTPAAASARPAGRPPAAPRFHAAHTARLSAVAGEGWLAVGDAAVSHDPLASYGISAALGAGFYAAAAVADYLGGSREALRAYAQLIDRAFAQYLLLHHDRYLSEQRWPDAPFWRRRHAPDFRGRENSPD